MHWQLFTTHCLCYRLFKFFITWEWFHDTVSPASPPSLVVCTRHHVCQSVVSWHLHAQSCCLSTVKSTAQHCYYTIDSWMQSIMISDLSHNMTWYPLFNGKSLSSHGLLIQADELFMHWTCGNASNVIIFTTSYPYSAML